MSDEKLNANSTLDKVLGYVDSPFKLFAILVMGVVAFAGYFCGRTKLSCLMLTRNPRSCLRSIQPVLTMPVQCCSRKLVQLWWPCLRSTHCLTARVLYKAYTKDGRDKSIEDIDVGLFSQNTANNADVVKLMTNEIPCSDYRYAQSEVGLWYLEKGVTYTCRVSVPPDSHRFVGQITVGWAQQPENLEQVKFMLEIASAMLTKRGN
jgi:hypothetical protein